MKRYIKCLLYSTLLLVSLDAKEYIIEDATQKSTYIDGKREGMMYWYDDKGKIKSQVNFKHNKEHGQYISYYDNGQMKLTVNYTAGQKDGIQKTYFNNGQLGSKVNYKKGWREGIMQEWDVEGFKLSEVFYKHHYKVGLKKYYNHKGEVVKTEEYKMDRNPMMIQRLKAKREETLIDLAKYGLMPKNTPEKERKR